MRALFGLAATIILCGTASAQEINCRVVGVSDGDTLTCLTAAQERIRVRLFGIDAPESKQPFGTRAKLSLSDMVYGKEVRLQVRDADRYGRTVAIVYTQNATPVNLKQIELGMAWAYRRFDPPSEWVTAEKTARKNRVGLWSERDPIEPSAWRRAN